MAFADSIVDDIKSRGALVQVVGRAVKLTKAGAEHKGLCPFHAEKDPSFTVNEAKQFYHCFGCGVHGDVIDFTMRIERMDFRAAVHKLALDMGLDEGQGAGDRPARPGPGTWPAGSWGASS